MFNVSLMVERTVHDGGKRTGGGKKRRRRRSRHRRKRDQCVRAWARKCIHGMEEVIDQEKKDMEET